MSNYRKFFAAIISGLIINILLKYFNIDVDELGVAPELNLLVTGLIASGEALFIGFWVWLFANTKSEN